MGETSAPDYVYLVKKDATRAINITPLITVLTASAGGNNYAFCEGSYDIDVNAEVTEHTGWNGTAWTTTPGENTWANFVECGQAYYLEFKFGSRRYYSEAFKIMDFPEYENDDPTNEEYARVRIEAVTLCMLDDIPPLGTHKIFVNGFTSDPEYIVEETVSEDGNGEKKLLWGKMKKRYHIKFYAVESVMDFCALLPIFHTVNIRDQYGFQSPVKVEDVKFTWGDDDGRGCVCLIDIAFTRDFATYSNCC
jgi:hypothetical protein